MRWLWFLAGAVLPAVALTDPGLTESEAVRLGLARPEVVEMLAARRRAALEREDAAGRWANPEIEYSSEDADLPGGTVTDRFFWITQRINLAGVPGLERHAAESARLASDARTDLERRELIAEIRTLYYNAIAATADAKAIARFHVRLTEAAADVTRRVAAGDASRFDRVRLDRELALIEGQRTNAAAKAASARDRLFSLLAVPASELAGSLLPSGPDETAAARLLENHPLLVALEAEARAAGQKAKALERARWPEVTVGVGRRAVEEPGIKADGQAISLGVELPIFRRGQAAAQEAGARARQLSSEQAITRSRLAADARAVVRELAARREAALAIREVSRGDSLALIAESAYDAGEMSVLELIDAYRTELTTEREAIARALAARQSYIELQLIGGDP